MLKTRILTALVLLPLMLAALFLFPADAWAGFSWLIILLALWEYARMTACRAPPWGYLAASSFCGVSWQQGWQMAAHVLSLVFWLLVMPLWLARRWTVKSPAWPPCLAGC
jgi:phosphatidate cytidylyltransferase